jgi:hypothetical protein
VHVAQQWIHQESLRNNHLANYNHSVFIYVFQFDFECTMGICTNSFRVFSEEAHQNSVGKLLHSMFSSGL